MFITKEVDKNVFSSKRNKIREAALRINYIDDFFNCIFNFYAVIIVSRSSFRKYTSS